MIYEAIGRAVVKFGSRYVRSKYRTQLRVGVGVAAAAVAVIVLRASRNVSEG